MELICNNKKPVLNKQKIQEAYERQHSPTKMSTPSKCAKGGKVDINTIETRTLAPNSRLHHGSFFVAVKHVSKFPSLAF